MNPKVDAYIARSTRWPGEMAELRTVLLACGLTEELKWGKPCYVHEGKNIGPTVAKILATYVVEKGKPVSTPAK